MTGDGNIYAYSRNETLRNHSACLQGPGECLFLVLCKSTLSAVAADALSKSTAALGYGKDAPLFVKLDSAHSPSSPESLFALIEGLDPLCIVACDPDSLQLLLQAYRTMPPNQTAFRLACREIRALPNIDELMKTNQGKQFAWSALKTLPHL